MSNIILCLHADQAADQQLSGPVDHQTWETRAGMAAVLRLDCLLLPSRHWNEASNRRPV